ncbi:hypothetical protein JXB01_02585 [Candidatus Micrarchaeota archaeon]|nr:hypothetical protein [Candidatus Micrarchaeota archaeon]
MMQLGIFFKIFIFLLAVSLIYFSFSPESILFLVKLVGLSLGVSLLISLVYPSLRGIKKGDKVKVITEGVPSLFGRSGIALGDAWVNREIRVRLNTGREVFGIVEDYGGFMSPAKVRILYEERLIE